MAARRRSARRTELAEIGYALAIYPSITGLAAAAAIENALRVFKAEGTSQLAEPAAVQLPRVPESLIGFEEVWAFESKWARD